jgi:hypothetical protein
MGQQQLLLVILVTIIVGIATVVAINTFGTSAEQANIDAVRQDIAAVATAAQAWYIRPAMLEGGGNSYTGLNFNNIPFGGTAGTTGEGEAAVANPLVRINANGTYTLSAITATGFTVTGVPVSNTDVTVTGVFTVADGLEMTTAGL